MTVGAVVLATDPDRAAADADGIAAVRRVVDAAWSGGAVPIVVVVAPDATTGSLVAGTPATVAPLPPTGPAAPSAVAAGHGVEAARRLVGETDAALIWPVEMAWVGPETVTSLIEIHGMTVGAIRPAYLGTAGWPLLVSGAALDAILGARTDVPSVPSARDLLRSIADAATPVDLGDPGSIHDVTTPRRDLPPYLGPPEPPAAHAHEWGAAAADRDDDEPVEGPARLL